MSVLIGIIYCSKATTNFDEKDLIKLAYNASVVNKNLGVTGFLYFHYGYFIQYIEGDISVVQNLLDRIEKDKRHKVLYKLKSDPIAQRKFLFWHMKYITNKVLSVIHIEDMILKYLKYLINTNQISSNNKGLSNNFDVFPWGMIQRLVTQQHIIDNNRTH